MSFTANFHTEDDSAVLVEELPTGTVALHVGDYPGDHVTIFGPLERLQRIIADVVVGLKQVEKDRASREFEATQQREHSVFCGACAAGGRSVKTWNQSGLCEDHDALRQTAVA